MDGINRLKTKLLFVVSLSCCLLINSCVSVKIPTGGSDKIRATNLTFSPPHSPFLPATTELADMQWTSSKTGNSISVLSECKVRNEPSLDVLQKEVLSAIDVVKVDDQKITFNEREALRIRAQGTLDGVPVQMESIIFKKNSCSYTITFGGRMGQLKSEVPQFETFLKDFQAP